MSSSAKPENPSEVSSAKPSPWYLDMMSKAPMGRGLDGELDIYLAFGELEREQAKLARVKALVAQIHDLTQFKANEAPLTASGRPASKAEVLSARLQEIALLSESDVDMDLFADTAWMIAERLVRREALPQLAALNADLMTEVTRLFEAASSQEG